jgi:hypothetical protein
MLLADFVLQFHSMYTGFRWQSKEGINPVQRHMKENSDPGGAFAKTLICKINPSPKLFSLLI